MAKQNVTIASRMVRRYVKSTLIPLFRGDKYETTFTDRTTGRVILRWDAVDRGSIPDEEIFERHGRDFNEEIDITQSVIPVDDGEV